MFQQQYVTFSKKFGEKFELEDIRKSITVVSNRMLSESASFMTGHLKEFQGIQTKMQAELDDQE